MITNAREYRITRAAVKRFELALADVERLNTDRHPLLQQALRESMASELGMLREQLTSTNLQDGQVRILEADSLAGLPEALIRARIAAGITQKTLADRLGLKEQQIQRYEASTTRLSPSAGSRRSQTLSVFRCKGVSCFRLLRGIASLRARTRAIFGR